MVEVETSLQHGADCSSGVDVRFLVGDTWTKPEVLLNARIDDAVLGFTIPRSRRKASEC